MIGLFRRFLGVVVAIAPIALAVVSIAWHPRHPPFPLIADALVGTAMFFAMFNLWLSFGRPMYWRWRKPAAEYKHASGAPLVGNALAVGALVAGFSALDASIFALAALLLDVGGAPWFVALTWRSRELWDLP